MYENFKRIWLKEYKKILDSKKISENLEKIIDGDYKSFIYNDYRETMMMMQK